MDELETDKNSVSYQKLFQDLSLGDRNHVELFFEISIVGLTQV